MLKDQAIFKPGVPATGQCVPGFLESFLSANVCMHLCLRVCVCVFVCPPPRLLITSDVMWCDIDPYDWLNKSYGFYMAAVVGIDSGSSDVSIYTRSGN